MARNAGKIRETEQSVLNQSFDTDFNTLVVEQLGYDPVANGLNRIQAIPPYDFAGLSQPDGVTDVYTFKLGGSGGATVQTLTVVYTDSSHNTLSTLTRS